MITCHEIQKDGDRLYLAYRDEGVVILDITDPEKPVRIDGGYDYSPPFNGDPRLPREGCCPGAHTFMPAHHLSDLATIAVLTDEHFSCPPGFGRVLDITDPKHITLLSTYHIRGIDDQYDHDKKQFICPEGSQESAHMAEFDHRVKAGNLFYQAWYNQGLARNRHHQSLPTTRGRLLHLSEFQRRCAGPEGPSYPRALSGLGLRPDLCNGWERGRSDRAALYRPAADQAAHSRCAVTLIGSLGREGHIRRRGHPAQRYLRRQNLPTRIGCRERFLLPYVNQVTYS